MGSYTTSAVVCAVSLGLLLIISYKNVLSVSSTMQLQYLGWVWNQLAQGRLREYYHAHVEVEVGPVRTT